MANKKITDLMSGTPVRDSLLESAIDISGTMDSRKVKAGAVADLASVNVAAPYDSTVTYAIGQYCLQEGNIYRCIAPTTGAFDSTAWVQIVVTGEFRRVVELTSAQYTALSSAEKNNGTLYIITDEETTAADIPYSQGVSVADKLDALSEIGEIKTSAWTANSASSYGTNLTDSISVTKGVWIISASFPNCSVSFSAYINGISTNSDVSDQFESILIGGSSAKMSMIVKFSGNSSLQLRAAGSTSVTFSDITRGYLKAVKVAP